MGYNFKRKRRDGLGILYIIRVFNTLSTYLTCCHGNSNGVYNVFRFLNTLLPFIPTDSVRMKVVIKVLSTNGWY